MHLIMLHIEHDTLPLQVLLLGHRAPQLVLASSQRGRLHGVAALSCCTAGEFEFFILSYSNRSAHIHV